METAWCLSFLLFSLCVCMFCLSVYLSVWIQLIDSHSLPFTAGYFPFQLPFILNFIPIPKLGGSVALMLDSSRRAWVQIAAATLSGNMLRQTVHTNCASVHRGPFCAWVQHANHSATELLQTNKKTRKIIFSMLFLKHLKTWNLHNVLMHSKHLLLCQRLLSVVAVLLFACQQAEAARWEGHVTVVMTTRTPLNHRRISDVWFSQLYTRRPYTCEIIPAISQYETVITGINCMYFFVTAVVYTVQSITGFLYGQCERLFVTELNNKHFTRQIF